MKWMLSGVVAAAVLAGSAAPATATSVQRVLVLSHGKVRAVEEPTVRVPDDARPTPRAAAAGVARARALDRAQATKSVLGALRRLRDDGKLDEDSLAARTKTWRSTMATIPKLSGRRRIELSAVAANVSALARSGGLTAPRLNPVFLTLERNLEWWGNPKLPLLAYGTRVQFKGSSMLWESYPGQGIQLHPLANWSKLLAFVQQYGTWRTHIKPFLNRELLPTGVPRAGGIAWEYYFTFDGGHPPWVSSIAQGTAIEALTQAAKKMDDPSLLELAHRAMGVFKRKAPTGVVRHVKGGDHYLIYSFAPKYFVLNAFIQSLIGLYDLGQTGDKEAKRLFHRGDVVARRQTPKFDTGRWSKYSMGGPLSSYSYHVLLRDFLSQLCSRTHTRVYCRTARRFTTDLG